MLSALTLDLHVPWSAIRQVVTVRVEVIAPDGGYVRYYSGGPAQARKFPDEMEGDMKAGRRRRSVALNELAVVLSAVALGASFVRRRTRRMPPHLPAPEDPFDGAHAGAPATFVHLSARHQTVSILAITVGAGSLAVLFAAEHFGSLALELLAISVFFASVFTYANYLMACPRDYVTWLKQLEPYAPTSFWEQALAMVFASFAGVGTLVVGAVVGTDAGRARSNSELWSLMADNYWVLTLAAIVAFVSATILYRLAILHSRAIRNGQLPERPDAEKPPGPFVVFVTAASAWALMVWVAVSAVTVIQRGI